MFFYLFITRTTYNSMHQHIVKSSVQSKTTHNFRYTDTSTPEHAIVNHGLCGSNKQLMCLFKGRGGRHLEKMRIAITQPLFQISSPFGVPLDMDSPQCAVTSFLGYNKIQDGGRPPFWKKENRRNSAAISAIFTKFGVLVAMDCPQRSLKSFFNYNKIRDGGRAQRLK